MFVPLVAFSSLEAFFTHVYIWKTTFLWQHNPAQPPGGAALTGELLSFFSVVTFFTIFLANKRKCVKTFFSADVIFFLTQKKRVVCFLLQLLTDCRGAAEPRWSSDALSSNMSDVAVRKLDDFLWAACLSSEPCEDHQPEFCSNLIPQVWWDFCLKLWPDVREVTHSSWSDHFVSMWTID